MTRTNAELGAGLAAAREARPIRAGERIHILGIAGAGASAAALLAKAAGADVSGCDPGGPSPYTPAVEAAGIPIAWSHDAAHVADGVAPDRLAVTKALTAIDPDHPELVGARERGIEVGPWQQVIADAAFARRLVAVAGTHGKSTTSGWLTWVLAEAGLDPSAFVGALLPARLTGGIPATARVGQGSVFVVEADEYAGNFDPYRPDVAAVTSIEWDHPDVFRDHDATVSAFDEWLERVPGATLVANHLDPGVADLVFLTRDRPGRTVLAGVLEAGQDAANLDVWARIGASGPSSTTVLIEHGGLDLAAVLPTAGRHNATNGLLVAATALALGVEPETLRAGLESFQGIGRRLERKGEARGVAVYDDYGHHPTAIRATLQAMRQREPGKPLWAVYEPLTYHRTAAMLDAFAEALAMADGVAVADIWASRDPDTTITSAAALAQAVRERRSDIVVEAPGSVEETAAWLAAQVEPGDAVLVMGGGRSYRIAELLLEHLGGHGV